MTKFLFAVAIALTGFVASQNAHATGPSGCGYTTRYETRNITASEFVVVEIRCYNGPPCGGCHESIFYQSWEQQEATLQD